MEIGRKQFGEENWREISFGLEILERVNFFGVERLERSFFGVEIRKAFFGVESFNSDNPLFNISTPNKLFFGVEKIRIARKTL